MACAKSRPTDGFRLELHQDAGRADPADLAGRVTVIQTRRPPRVIGDPAAQRVHFKLTLSDRAGGRPARDIRRYGRLLA